MNIYIESNFILELAFFQKQYEYCEKILDLAESKKITLILPSFCIPECYESIKRSSSQKNIFKAENQRFQTRFSQSTLYEPDAETFTKINDLIDRSIVFERKSLNSIVFRLTKICLFIPLNHEIIVYSEKCVKQYGMKEPDAIIYASFLEFLKKGSIQRSCILNKNSKDFSDPELIEELKLLNCEIKYDFTSGYQYIDYILKKS